MNKQDIQLLLAYNRWANAQILAAASRLTAEQLTRDLATSHHSVHGTLTHTLWAEWIWLMRCKGSSPKLVFDPADFPGLDSLRVKWTAVESEQQRLIDDQTDESLQTVISYTNTKGEQWKYPLGQVLQHVVNHSTYHRGQVITLLRQLGAEVVITDFLIYIDTQAQSA